MTNDEKKPDELAEDTPLQRSSNNRTIRARAKLSDFGEQANAGADAEKLLNRHDANDVAAIDAARQDYCDKLDRERMELLLDGAKRGLADIESSRVQEADAAISHLQQQREAAASGKAAKKPC